MQTASATTSPDTQHGSLEGDADDVVVRLPSHTGQTWPVDTLDRLGISLAWAATASGVSEAEISAWIARPSSGMPLALERLLTVLTWRLKSMGEEELNAVLDSMEAGTIKEGEVAVLVAFPDDHLLWERHPDLHGLPASAHRALLKRLMEKLSLLGLQPAICDYDPAAYRGWLAQYQAADTARALDAWAFETSSRALAS